MKKLNLLFTKDGLQYQILSGRTASEVKSFFVTEETPENFIQNKLQEHLASEKFAEVSVISAFNHFTLMPVGFSQHEMGYELIAYNAPVDKENEELMLSVNKKYGIQFYYAFPKVYYSAIKSLEVPAKFNFSGEKFLNSLQHKSGKEIHIHLYNHQCEFFALDGKRVVLYNNLDVNSEVDFLYFIMFTLSKINFGLQETSFYVYGETTENDTFVSELNKFVNHLKIVFDNTPNKNFILN